MDQSFSMQRDWGAMNDGESDDVKRIFLEGNPLLLAVTVVVSMLHSGACWGRLGEFGGADGSHSGWELTQVQLLALEGSRRLAAPTFGCPSLRAVFDMLAFKNDIGER